jgi:hypothetical protein
MLDSSRLESCAPMVCVHQLAIHLDVYTTGENYVLFLNGSSHVDTFSFSHRRTAWQKITDLIRGRDGRTTFLEASWYNRFLYF